MRPPRNVLLALSAAVAWSCASAPTQTRSPAPSVGCYQFERNAGARTLGLPWGVELESGPLGTNDGQSWPLMTGLDGVRRARTATSPRDRADIPFGYWRPVAGDSIEVGYPGGGGIALTLGHQGQDLVGQGIAAGDAVPLGGSAGPRTPAPVVARRVLCGAS